MVTETVVQVDDFDGFGVEQSDDGRLRGMGREQHHREGAPVVFDQVLPAVDQLPENQ